MIDPFNDEYFMKQALIEARAAADEGEVPVGAVIVCNNRIIARAHNQTERLNDPTRPCRDAGNNGGAVGVLGAKYLTGCSLYVTVEPCVMCAGADRLVATEQDRLRSFRRKKRLPAIRTESLTSKSDSQKRDSRKRMRRRNAQLLSAQALNSLFDFLIVHILPFIFRKDLFTGGL